jgi:hypothetical protein
MRLFVVESSESPGSTMGGTWGISWYRGQRATLKLCLHSKHTISTFIVDLGWYGSDLEGKPIPLFCTSTANDWRLERLWGWEHGPPLEPGWKAERPLRLGQSGKEELEASIIVAPLSAMKNNFSGTLSPAAKNCSLALFLWHLNHFSTITWALLDCNA